VAAAGGEYGYTPAWAGRSVNRRAIAWVALALWVLSLVLSVLGVVFLDLSASTPIPPGFGFRGIDVIFAAVFSTVGVVIASRRPHNPVGWLLCAAGLEFAVVAFTAEYVVYAVLTRPGSFLGPEAAWVESWSWPSVLAVLACAILLFPDGRLLSPRWWPAVWVAGIGWAMAAVGFALSPGPLDEFEVVRNPFGLEDAGLLTTLFVVGGMLGLGLPLLAAGASLVLRLRRARGEQRQQLKWVAYTATLAATTFAAGLVSFLLLGTRPGVLVAAYICALAAIPVAAGIAILRYRLYEIDRLINRTLVYGLLTVLLGAAYASTVLLLGQLSGGVGGDPPGWAVAGATLAAAALFQPARRRIQQVVDRRFNRRRYDAVRTVEAFSTRLRHEVDLDTLSAELVVVVKQTVQPTRTWLWLRPSPDRTPKPRRRTAVGPTAFERRTESSSIDRDSRRKGRA
jgi:hypothetical protein